MKDQSTQFFESMGAARMLPQLLVHADTGAIVDVNEASAAFYRWPRATMQCMLIGDLDTDLAQFPDQFAGPSSGESSCWRQRVHRVAGGMERSVSVCATMVNIGERPLLHVVVHEIAEAAEAAEAARTSGPRDSRRIVHDFNNLLTVLRGSAEFLRDGIEPSSQALEDLVAIERATDRAEELLNELLAALPKS